MKNWENEYDEHNSNYIKLQQEAYEFVQELREEHQKSIHISDVCQRPNGEVKDKGSIEKNIAAKKYEGRKSLLELDDIAGVRVTCHCEDDVENFSTLLEGEIKKKYTFVDSKVLDHPYGATHITLSKPIDLAETSEIICEIQLRTILADAWAVQSHKYVYKKNEEGDSQDLSLAVSDIMNGCERLWSLVKKKSLEGETVDYIDEISKIQKKSDKKLRTIKRSMQQIHTLQSWFAVNKRKALHGLHELDLRAFMEVKIDLPQTNLTISKKDLDKSAQASTIKTFGWPIGIYLGNRPEFCPKPNLEGIQAEVSIKGRGLKGETRSYDYWSIHESGSYYLLKSLFEDSRDPDSIFFNTRIIRITEVFMYINNLYSNLNLPKDEKIEVTITHGGLKGRILGSSSISRELSMDYKTETDEIPTTVQTTLQDINSNITDIVEEITKRLFEQFELFELSHEVLKDIVQNYLKGKVV